MMEVYLGLLFVAMILVFIIPESKYVYVILGIIALNIMWDTYSDYRYNTVQYNITCVRDDEVIYDSVSDDLQEINTYIRDNAVCIID